MTDAKPIAFRDQAALENWLSDNHQTETELWIKIYKKASGIPSVTWQDCVVAAIAWGWIDGLKRPLGDRAWLQRLTPRRPGSNWSKKNVAHAERLIAEGRMQPAGLAHVAAARADGRWDAAYSTSADMEIPEDFLQALARDEKAKATFDSLSRSHLFAIYTRLHDAKRPETRAKRKAEMLARLSLGDKPV